MRILVLVHPDLIPPEVEDEEQVAWESVPWVAEYDVISTLRRSGHDVMVLGVSESLSKIRKAVEEHQPSIVFNLLEEFLGEAVFDQNVVSFLEIIGMPYTGCNPKGLMLARDKSLSKKIMAYHRIKTPKFQVFPRNRPNRKIRLKDFPVIVKCLTEESSRGISQASIVHNELTLRERAQFLHNSFNVDAIAETFIEGTEFFVGVIGNYRLEAFTPWELRYNKSSKPTKEFYSSRAKHSHAYRSRKGIETGAAELDPAILEKLQTTAKRAYRVLGLNGYARIDIRLSKNNDCVVLEANPNPDISEFDDFAQSAAYMGIEYADLLEKIIKLGRRWTPEQGPASF